MSEQQTETTTQETATEASGELKLNGLFAFKIGMMTIYDENGAAIPVTALKYDPLVVTQLKTKEKDGYEAVQVSFKPKPVKNSNTAEQGHLKKAGLKNISFYFSKEILQSPEGISVGQKVSLNSFEKGQRVSLTSHSKGRGFAGSLKRHNFSGGPGSHGSKFHRQPGSMGMRTWPGRVLKGKKLPGHFGDEKTTVKKMQIVDVIADENVLLVKGAVPGAMNSLVKLVKE